MRTILFSILVGLVVLPARGQDAVERWRSFLEGTWAAEETESELVLEFESGVSVDTLRLSLSGPHAPFPFKRETIECLLQIKTAGGLTVTDCPRTTLARALPPRDTTLHLPSKSEERLGLRLRAEEFAGEAKRVGDSLVVGPEAQYRLGKQK